MKLFSVCETCKKRRFVVKCRKIMLPIGEIATSKKLICRKCQKLVQKAINIK